MSIRWRLTLLNAVALTVLLAGLAVLIYALLARAVIGSVDRKLGECWQQLEREPRTANDPARLKYWIDEFWEHNQVAVAVYASDGRALVRTETLAADAVPGAPGDLTGAPRFASTKLPIIGRQRQMTAPLPHVEDGRTIVLMAGLADADRTLAQLRAALVTAVPVMALLAALVAYVLAARALAPMGTLVREARAISADSLDRRLPVANPHDELGQLTATVNEMVARLERSFAEMKRFTADASHELRTPLAVLRAEAEVALSKPLAPDEVPHLLGSILEECERLTRLTDQLLVLARQDAGLNRERLEIVPMNELLHDVVETMRPLADAKGLNLRWIESKANASDTVRGEPARLRQVFVNLLDNAIKHTPAGGRVEMDVTGNGAMLRVEVRDTGEGIAAEHLPRVFDRFYRVDKARSRDLGGTGLGLSIAKSIVDAHGGRIELESAPGRGTTYTVTLPQPSRD